MNPRYERRGDAAWIVLDDGKANAMRTDGLRALAGMLDRARDEGARAIVIRGRDGMYSGGLDLKWLPSLEPAAMRELVEAFSSTMLAVLASEVPTVAAVSGHAIAGGCMLACACDRRIGLRGPYRMQLNEVAVGIPMPAWASLIATSAIPAPRLYDVLQLAAPLSFEEAHALGTLHDLADSAAELDAKAEAAATALAMLSAPAFATTKQRLWATEIERVKQLRASE